MLLHGKGRGGGRAVYRVRVDTTLLFPYVYMVQVDSRVVATVSDADLVPLAELLIVAYRDRLKRDADFRDSEERRLLNAMLHLDDADTADAVSQSETGS